MVLSSGAAPGSGRMLRTGLMSLAASMSVSNEVIVPWGVASVSVHVSGPGSLPSVVGSVPD